MANEMKFQIFLAGSTQSPSVLKAKRHIKEVIKEQEYDFKKDYNVDIEIKDCDDISNDNSQEKHNRSIEEDADIFVLVVDKTPLGPYSFEELMRACLQHSKHKHPDVYLYYKKALTGDPYISDLLNVVEKLSGKYSMAFDEEEALGKDFVSRLKEKIRAKRKKQEEALLMLEKQRMKEEKQKTEQAKQLKKAHRLKMCKRIMSAVGVAILLVMAYLIPKFTKENPIFFAGGGTTRQFLADKDIEFAHRTDGIYIHIPTGDAWVMLGEEHKENEGAENKNYYPVILAADDIRDNMSAVKIKDTLAFVNNTGKIADFKIGKDPLFVSIPKDEKLLAPLKPFLKHLNENSITPDELYAILSHFHLSDSVVIYHTTRSSGTIATYRKAMEAAVEGIESENWCWLFDNQKGHEEYNNYNTKLSDVLATPFLSLESQYYHIKNITDKDSEARQLRFVNTKGEQLYKNLHLYFILKRKKLNGDIFYLEEPVKRFLTEVMEAKGLGLSNLEVKDEYTIHSPNFTVLFNNISMK